MDVIKENTWRQLYEQAHLLRQMAPWEWMFDTDLFGVENPLTGEIGYCCIMGRDGQFLGMAVYRGRRGLASYERLQGANVDHPMLPPIQAFEQDCLMISFSSREELPNERLQHIRNLDIKFRGKSHWPDFLDYSPGMVPWPIQSEAQAQFLLVAIKQAMEVARRCQQDQDLLDHVEGAASCLLVRRPQTDDNTWQDRWVPIGPPPAPEPNVTINKLFLRSNGGALPKQPHVWVIDIFYFPNPVQEGEQRPYLPVMLVIIDKATGMIIGHAVFQPGVIETQLQETFIKIVREQGYLPEQILVSSLETLAYWIDIAQELDIELRMEENLQVLNEVKFMLFGSLSL